MDIVFVLDSSGSVMAANWLKALSFTQQVISNFPLHPELVRVGVVSFGNQATPHIRLDDFDKEMDLFSAIGMIKFKDQWTNTAAGLRVAREQVFGQSPRDNARKVIILMTDGESNRDKLQTLPEAELTRDAGIEILVIAVGDEANLDEALDITGDASQIFIVPSFEELTERQPTSSIMEYLCGKKETLLISEGASDISETR